MKKKSLIQMKLKKYNLWLDGTVKIIWYYETRLKNFIRKFIESAKNIKIFLQKLYEFKLLNQPENFI